MNGLVVVLFCFWDVVWGLGIMDYGLWKGLGIREEMCGMV